MADSPRMDAAVRAELIARRLEELRDRREQLAARLAFTDDDAERSRSAATLAALRTAASHFHTFRACDRLADSYVGLAAHLHRLGREDQSSRAIQCAAAARILARWYLRLAWADEHLEEIDEGE